MVARHGLLFAWFVPLAAIGIKPTEPERTLLPALWDKYKRYHEEEIARGEWGVSAEGEIHVEGSLNKGASTDLMQQRLQSYREYIQNLQKEPFYKNETFSKAGEGYDLCKMCKAMYVDGTCSSAQDQTDANVEDMREKLSRMTTVVKNTAAKRAWEKQWGLRQKHVNISTRHTDKQWADDLEYIEQTRESLKEMRCEDDGDVWWDTCAKQPCMNNMEGIDASCKYRVAAEAENPLGGDFKGVIAHAFKQHPTEVDKEDALDGKNYTNEEMMANVTLLPPEFQIQVLMGYYTGSFAYMHAHCGAGVDQRSVALQCHFPAKKWCLQVGAFAHVKTCGKMFCEPCLWTCKTRAEKTLIANATPTGLGPALYIPSNDLLDTLLPQECVQDPDMDEADANFKVSSCDNPLRNSNLGVAQPWKYDPNVKGHQPERDDIEAGAAGADSDEARMRKSMLSGHGASTSISMGGATPRGEIARAAKEAADQAHLDKKAEDAAAIARAALGDTPTAPSSATAVPSSTTTAPAAAADATPAATTTAPSSTTAAPAAAADKTPAAPSSTTTAPATAADATPAAAPSSTTTAAPAAADATPAAAPSSAMTAPATAADATPAATSSATTAPAAAVGTGAQPPDAAPEPASLPTPPVPVPAAAP